MSALFDEDDYVRDAEEITRQYADAVARRDEVAALADRLLTDLRLDLTEVALAQELHHNTDEFLGGVFEALREVDPVILANALMRALWDKHRLPEMARALAVEVRSCTPEPAALPLTCASPDAHLREVRRSKPLHWLRAIGLLGDGPPPVDCPVCWKPLPKSHRRKP